MKKRMYSVLSVMLILLPLTMQSQVEDTLYIPNLLGTGMFLNQIILQDTAGTGWQGANGPIAWQNHTRVYVLQKNGIYPCNGSFSLPAGSKLVIRAEAGNYVMPAHYGDGSNPATANNDWKPIIRFEPSGVNSLPQGNFVQCTGDKDTIILKNIAMCGYDEDLTGGIDGLQGSLLVIAASGGGSIYLDSCVMKSINGQIIQTAGRAYTIQVTNSLFADLGFLGTSNFGAGKGIDLRNSEVDAVIMENNTIVNYQDRIIRHYLSKFPIHSIKFNHNTVINGMAYDAMLSFGWVDSLSEGPFEIKNNLFYDNFAMGSDTDLVRQGEFNDNPDNDPNNGKSAMTWIVLRPNSTGHNNPWVISNNYYCVSEAGAELRNYSSLHHAPYNVGGEEPIMTSDLKRQVAANGGDTINAFKKVIVKPTYAPNLMSKLTKWYWTAEGDGTGGNTVDNVGAGAGKKKTGSAGTPASHFIKAAPGVWVYDYDRRRTDWYMDSLNANMQASVGEISKMVSSDGKPVGDPRWGAPTRIFTGSETIVVDGDKDAFYGTLTGPGDGYLQLKSSAFNDNGRPASDDDLSAKIWTAWDNDWFYLYTEVKDDTISGNGANSYQDDGLELKFDPQAKDSVASTIFAPNLTILGGSGSDSLNAVPNAQKQWARKTISGGYALELGINWSVITSGTEKVSVGVDSVFGLAINIHDNDGNLAIGGGRQASVMWSAVMLDAVWNTPRYLGTVIFQTDHKLAFIAQNNMTPWRMNTTVKYDGSDPSLSVKTDRTGVPTEFAVGQNYPNPFNPSTTIKYQLPVSGQVTMKVYNFLGQEVATLVNTHQQAAYYTVSFDASRFASGVYFYTLRAGNFVETRKMLLIK